MHLVSPSLLKPCPAGTWATGTAPHLCLHPRGGARSALVKLEATPEPQGQICNGTTAAGEAAASGQQLWLCCAWPARGMARPNPDRGAAHSQSLQCWRTGAARAMHHTPRTTHHAPRTCWVMLTDHPDHIHASAARQLYRFHHLGQAAHGALDAQRCAWQAEVILRQGGQTDRAEWGQGGRWPSKQGALGQAAEYAAAARRQRREWRRA